MLQPAEALGEVPAEASVAGGIPSATTGDEDDEVPSVSPRYLDNVGTP